MTSNKSFFRIPDSSLFSEPSTWVLIAVNLIPLFGVFFWDWDLFSLMVLYWMETAMIGFYQLIKIILYQWLFAVFLVPFFSFHFGMFMFVHFTFISALFGPPWAKALHGSVSAILNRLLFQEGFWVPALALFISHGVSFFLHGVRPSVSVVTPEDPVAPAPVIHPHPDAAAYHSTEDWDHTIESTPLRVEKPIDVKALSASQQALVSTLTKTANNMNQNFMTEPYKRVVVMHLTIILGGFLAVALKTTQAAMVIMIALKIAADLFSHANYNGLGDKAAVLAKIPELG